jgi:adenylate cyclase
VKSPRARHALGLVLLLAMLGHAVQAYRIDLFDRLDAIFYDARLRLTMPRGVDNRIVIVDIDEKSLAEQGRWPWARDRVALLLDKLFDHHGARVVGLDIVFAEPDYSSGIRALDTLAEGELHGNKEFKAAYQAMRPGLDHDARLAAALRGRSTVLSYYLSKDEDGRSSGVLPEPTLPAGAFDNRPVAVTQWLSFGANLTELQAAASSAGHFNPLVDFDGISRRVPLLAEYDGAYYESLSLAVVRASLGFPPVVPVFEDASGYGGLEWIELWGQEDVLRIPVDENVAALIPYRGPQGSFLYVSATDVLQDRIPAGSLKDRIILVGTTAPGLMDLRATPVAAIYPGVEIHANLIAGMLDSKIKYRPGYMMAADAVQVFLVGILLILLLPRLTPPRATLLASFVLLGLIAVNFYLWLDAGYVMPLAAVGLLVVLLYGTNMTLGYFVESRTKRQFAELFGRYVPPELVEEMARNPEGYSMAGRKAELTVLFSDIRGFTTISEGLQPDQLAALLNEYLGAMTEVVRKRRGTLDKYIGDAIMAFWGAPMADERHASHAVHAALEMQAALQELNPQLVSKGWPELKIGIGINTGAMTVGDMGSPVRKAYTVMGDAVNLGSRLEGITKQYGVGVIVGEGTRSMLGDEFVLRELDRVRVKGKSEPVAIYEPLGVKGQVATDVLAELDEWSLALQSYRSQAWDRAEAMLKNLLRKRPHCLYDLYVKRIARYRDDSPGSNWDGVTTFETK